MLTIEYAENDIHAIMEIMINFTAMTVKLVKLKCIQYFLNSLPTTIIVHDKNQRKLKTQLELEYYSNAILCSKERINGNPNYVNMAKVINTRVQLLRNELNTCCTS